MPFLMRLESLAGILWIFINFLKHLYICVSFPKMLWFFDWKPFYPHFLISLRVLFFDNKSFFEWCFAAVVVFWVQPIVIGYSMTENIIFKSILRLMLILFAITVSYFDWIIRNKVWKVDPFLIEVNFEHGEIIFDLFDDFFLRRW